jgi:hypothetical protein
VPPRRPRAPTGKNKAGDYQADAAWVTRQTPAAARNMAAYVGGTPGLAHARSVPRRVLSPWRALKQTRVFAGGISPGGGLRALRTPPHAHPADGAARWCGVRVEVMRRWQGAGTERVRRSRGAAT